MPNEPKVEIGLREIYDTLLGVASGVQNLNERVKNLEEKSASVENVEDTARQALDTANEAKTMAKETKENLRWLSRSFVGAVIFVGVGFLFNYLKH